jgi:hypothetical protein
MIPVNNSVFESVKGLGSPGELRNLAMSGYGMDAEWKFNTHIHLPPNFSAFQSVREAMGLAAQEKIKVLGTSNYYDFGVYREFAEIGRSFGIFPLFGLEIISILEDFQRNRVLINDPGNPGRMYLCGKGIFAFLPMSPEAALLIGEVRQNDAARMIEMIGRIGRVFSSAGSPMDLDESRIKAGIIGRCGAPPDSIGLQERHIAQAFQEAVFDSAPVESRVDLLSRVFGAVPKSNPHNAAGIQNEIRGHLMKVGKPAYVPEKFLSFDQAYQLILALGGIPCYPTLADGTSPICPYETPPEKLAGELISRRIYCAEFIPVRNKPEVLETYVRTLRAAGIAVTCGTEHNTPDLIPLEPSCIHGAPIAPEIQNIFREGACISAAHQYLGSIGETGYVDRQGGLNASFVSAEDRIRYFHRLGAAVIARYHHVYSN